MVMLCRQELIELAAKMMEWAALSEAVEIMIRQQGEFCQWWTDHVTPGFRLGSNQWVSQERGITMPQAEADTGITNQQVSRWNQGLADVDAYRDKIYLAACRKAGIEPAENHRSGCAAVIGERSSAWSAGP